MSKGIQWCGVMTVGRLRWGNEVFRKRIQPGDTEAKVSLEMLRRIESGSSPPGSTMATTAPHRCSLDELSRCQYRYPEQRRPPRRLSMLPLSLSFSWIAGR